jgi:hypothetical protein
MGNVRCSDSCRDGTHCAIQSAIRTTYRERNPSVQKVTENTESAPAEPNYDLDSESIDLLSDTEAEKIAPWQEGDRPISGRLLRFIPKTLTSATTISTGLIHRQMTAETEQFKRLLIGQASGMPNPPQQRKSTEQLRISVQQMKSLNI